MYVVGIGPGSVLDRTRRAEAVIRESGVVAGYTRYLELVEDLTEGKQIIASGMTGEVERCRTALQKADEGRTVALISSGDAGVYGMAGLAFELAESESIEVEIEVIPGVTAALSAGALLGAPLALDFSAISLSDLLVDWEMITRRLEAVAGADMTVALYNPKSKKRTQQIEEAGAIFRKHRPGATLVGICDRVGLEGEAVVISNLENFLNEEIGMRTTVIICSSATRLINGKLVMPRGYKL